jgi:hypothetical protein
LISFNSCRIKILVEHSALASPTITITHEDEVPIEAHPAVEIGMIVIVHIISPAHKSLNMGRSNLSE